MTAPCIGIALCTHNGERFIDEQLHSLASQSRPADYLEIHDWGSRDGTRERVTAFLRAAHAARDSRFLCHEQVRGACAGFLEATQSLLKHRPGVSHLMFCDQDDRWSPRRIECYVDRIQASDRPTDLLFSDVRLIDAHSQAIGDSLYRVASPYRRNPSLYSSDIALVNPALGMTLCISRRLAERLVASAGPHWRMHDWAAVLLARIDGLNCQFVDEMLADYRQHGGNALGAPSLSALPRKLMRRPQQVRALAGQSLWLRRQAGSKAEEQGLRLPGSRFAAATAIWRSSNLKPWAKLLLASQFLVFWPFPGFLQHDAAGG